MSRPLRKIVAVLTPTTSVFARVEVELECGHRKWIWSETQARTHCRHCPETPERPVSARTQRIREAQRSGGGPITAVMVSRGK